MTVTDDRIVDVVRTAVAEAMFVDKDDVQPGTRILGDLGAESIDLLDILFRIERESGVKADIGDLSLHFQGDLPDEQFYDARGVVTPAGLNRLRESVPNLDLGELGPEITSDVLMKQITVEYVADRVAELAQSKVVEAS
jgi:acyl carrier protein